MNIQILKRNSLHEGGFAGLREYRLVQEPELFGPTSNLDGSWPGLGNFVYLADARFMPHGETYMHAHHEVDIISVLVDGRILHYGTMGNGAYLENNTVQIQRAGREGLLHNETNPDGKWNRMIQIWVLPEEEGLASDYKIYKPMQGAVTTVYGGEYDQYTDFPAKTQVDVARLKTGQLLELDTPFMGYVTRGMGIANDREVEDGDLIRGDSLQFEALRDMEIILINTRYQR